MNELSAVGSAVSVVLSDKVGWLLKGCASGRVTVQTLFGVKPSFSISLTFTCQCAVPQFRFTMAPKKKGTSAFNKFLLVGLVFAGFCIGLLCQSQMSVVTGRADPAMMQLFEDAAGKEVEISHSPVTVDKAPTLENAIDLDDSNPNDDKLMDSNSPDQAADTQDALDREDEKAPSPPSFPTPKSFNQMDPGPSPYRQPLEPKVAKINGTSIDRRVGCNKCCNDGSKNGACFDVEACAAGVTGGRYAFVYAHVGDPGWPWLTFLDSMWAQAVKMQALGAVADIVVLMPGENIRNLGCLHHRLIKQYRLRMIEVPWTIPPHSWYPSYWWPGKADGWCGPQDLMRLHALGLDDYDAVVFYASCLVPIHEPSNNFV